MVLYDGLLSVLLKSLSLTSFPFDPMTRHDIESNLGKTFEELCRAHIQAFAKGAEDFAFNTKLSDRVNQWQSKLAPILEEEERRAAFDIHRYSEDLLESAKQGLQRIKRKSDGSEHVSFTLGFLSDPCPSSFSPLFSRPRRLLERSTSRRLQRTVLKVTSAGCSWPL